MTSFDDASPSNEERNHIKDELAQAAEVAQRQRQRDEEKAQQIKMQLLADLLQSRDEMQVLNEADVFDYSNLQPRTTQTTTSEPMYD